MNRLTLRTKLILGFLIMALLPLVIGVFTNVQIHHLSDNAEIGQELNQTYVELLNARRREKDFFLRKDDQYIAKNKEHVASMLAIAEKKSSDENLSPENRQLMAGTVTAIKEYSDAFLRQVELEKQATEANAAEIKAKEQVVVDAAHRIEDNIKKVNNDLKALMVAAYSRIKWMNGLIASGSFVLGIAFGLSLSIGLSRKINLVATALGAASNETSSASKQVASSSQELAGGASEQAASLEQTSASMEEISSIIKSNADNARNVKSLTTETHSITQKQTEGMESLQHRLGTLSDSARQMTDAISEIKTSSDSISQIIKTIDEIAFQTNILALNAAVEAARAGESGMGFAVVADEVRNLAKRSADAAKETSELIENAIHKSDAGVKVNEAIASVIREVKTNASEVQQGLQAISAKVENVDSAMTQIVNASEEQSRGAEQINLALTQMDKVTQTNAACAEEAAGASEELSAQAEELKALAHRLDEIVQGEGNADHTPTNNHSAPVRHATPAKSTRTPSPVAKASAPASRNKIPMGTSGDAEPDFDFKDM